MSSAESFVIMENYTQRGAMPQEFISYLPQFPVHFMSNSSRFDPTLQSWVTWKQILTILALQILALYYHAKVKTLGNKKHSVSTQADGNLLSCSAESAECGQTFSLTFSCVLALNPPLKPLHLLPIPKTFPQTGKNSSSVCELLSEC
jgi:hypothetical protein